MLENAEAVETALKMESGSIQKAIDSDEKVTIDIPSLVIRTTEEEEERDTNRRNEYKSEFETAGLEVGIKDYARELNLDIGRNGKNMKSFGELYKKKILAEAEIEPNEKVSELTTDLSTLKERYTTLEGELDTTKKNHLVLEQQRGIDSTLLKEIKGKLTISDKQVLVLFKAQYGTELNDSGALLIKENGTTMKNDLQTPLTPSEVMETFIKPFIKVEKPGGGAGGDDNPGGTGATTGVEKFIAEMAAQTPPITEGSLKFNEEMAARMKAGTLKL